MSHDLKTPFPFGGKTAAVVLTGGRPTAAASAFGVPGLEWLRDLQWFDGPLVQLFRSPRALYVVHWCDVEDGAHVWLVAEVIQDDVTRYEAGTVSLRDLVTRPRGGVLFAFWAVGTIDYRAPVKVQALRPSESKADWIPGPESFFNKELTP